MIGIEGYWDGRRVCRQIYICYSPLSFGTCPLSVIQRPQLRATAKKPDESVHTRRAPDSAPSTAHSTSLCPVPEYRLTELVHSAMGDA